jgi:hypothetical protein
MSILRGLLERVVPVISILIPFYPILLGSGSRVVTVLAMPSTRGGIISTRRCTRSSNRLGVRFGAEFNA